MPRYHALPEWLVRGADPVPLSDAFRGQAAATRIHAFLMSLIDGRRSIKDMAKLVVEQRLMTAAEAEPALRSFFIKMHDDSAPRHDLLGSRHRVLSVDCSSARIESAIDSGESAPMSRPTGPLSRCLSCGAASASSASSRSRRARGPSTPR